MCICGQLQWSLEGSIVPDFRSIFHSSWALEMSGIVMVLIVHENYGQVHSCCLTIGIFSKHIDVMVCDCAKMHNQVDKDTDISHL